MFTRPSGAVHAGDSNTLAIEGPASTRTDRDTAEQTCTRRRSVAVSSLLVALAVTTLTTSPARAALPGDPDDAPTAAGDACDCGPNPTLAKGQQRIHQGQYAKAVAIFSCILESDPLSLDAYRGRSEANLLRGRYSDAFRDYARITAVVLPVSPDAHATLLASYDARLAAAPWDVPALTGASFARWATFDYESALPLLDKLLTVRPYSVYANLFRGSNRLFLGQDVAGGEMDFTRALLLAPLSPDVRFIVADGYTYALPKPARALVEASLALLWGLDTPRVHAILASSYLTMNDLPAAADHLRQHIDLVTTETVATAALGAGDAETLDLVPGRTHAIPIEATAGQMVTLRTDSPSGAISDTILVLVDAGGSPVTGNDDLVDYYAGLDWVAPENGMYELRVTSFEGVGTGDLVVTRD